MDSLTFSSAVIGVFSVVIGYQAWKNGRWMKEWSKQSHQETQAFLAKMDERTAKMDERTAKMDERTAKIDEHIDEARRAIAKMDEHIAEARRSIVSHVEDEGRKTRAAVGR